MLRLFVGVLGLIAAVLVAGRYLHVNPVIPIVLVFCILGLGLYLLLSRGGVPRVPPGSGTAHRGSGEGIYFSGRDRWVEGQQMPDDPATRDRPPTPEANRTLH